ncbi:hypothetical protein ACP1S1_004641 [Escherichia coli]|nr:hypothetical protein [Escherichia coli]
MVRGSGPSAVVPFSAAFAIRIVAIAVLVWAIRWW